MLSPPTVGEGNHWDLPLNSESQAFPRQASHVFAWLVHWHRLLSIPSGFLVVFEKPNRSSFTFTFTQSCRTATVTPSRSLTPSGIMHVDAHDRSEECRGGGYLCDLVDPLPSPGVRWRGGGALQVVRSRHGQPPRLLHPALHPLPLPYSHACTLPVRTGVVTVLCGLLV